MTDTDVLRRFNRTYTQRIGALDESFLGLGLPLGAARLVFEIGEAGATVRDLRARLGLDSGHLARQLRRLEDDGLVRVAPDPDDRRRRTVRLTAAGRALRARLDDRSEELAERLVAPLTDRQQERLTEALATADLLVRAATVDIRAVQPGDRRRPQPRSALLRRARRAGSPTGFDPGDRRARRTVDSPGRAPSWWPPATASRSRAAASATWATGVGEIKRMWVHPELARRGPRFPAAAPPRSSVAARRSGTPPSGSTPTAPSSRRSRCTSAPATATSSATTTTPTPRRGSRRSSRLRRVSRLPVQLDRQQPGARPRPRSWSTWCGDRGSPDAPIGTTQPLRARSSRSQT